MNDRERLVIHPGTRVIVEAEKPFAAIVDSVQIRRHDELYEVAWWASDGRKTAWVSADQIRHAEDGELMQRVGFHAKP